ncbi:MAG: hypothetical protein Q9220_001139 [cf. Caloplaca sp. 1 TL-2023]
MHLINGTVALVLERSQGDPLVNQSAPSSFARTYATKPDISDRLHKAFVDYVAPRLFRKGQAPRENVQGDKKARKAVQDRKDDQQLDEGTITSAEDFEYTPAVSGESLESIGGPTGWWEEGWDEQNQFKGYHTIHNAPIETLTDPRKAIERALLEYYMIKQGSARSSRGLPPVRKYPWDSPPFEGFSIWQTQEGDVRIRWRSSEDEMVVRRWMRQPVQSALGTQDVDEMTDGSEGGEATDNLFEKLEHPEHLDTKDENLVDDTSLDRDAAQRLPEAKQATDGTEAQKAKFTGLQGSISLADPKAKFAIIKRVMQLTGIRIPDPIVQSIDCSQTLWNHLTQKPKPKKLAQILIEGQDENSSKKNVLKQKRILELSSLSNVKILPGKIVPEMIESALGRQKVIEKELDKHDIPVPFKDAIEAITKSETRRLARKGQLVAMPDEDVNSKLADLDSKELLRGKE